MTRALAAHGWQLELLPETGGAIAALRRKGRDILRPAPRGTTDPLETGCFPLVPYANRIAGGRFRFGGRDVRLEVPDRFAPHALHGQGWHLPWRVGIERGDRAELACHHPAGAWPWAWTARQRFVLEPDGFNAELALTNESPEPMPAGLGFHPYFPAGPASVLKFAAGSVWLTGTDLIPQRRRRRVSWPTGPGACHWPTSRR